MNIIIIIGSIVILALLSILLHLILKPRLEQDKLEGFQVIEKFMRERLEEFRNEAETHRGRLEKVEHERAESYGKLVAVIEEQKQAVSGVKESADQLRSLLSNNQLRGKYGEEIAENILKSSGFVQGQHYYVNTAQNTTTTRPDFTILLPNGMKVNIDVKFPFQSFVRYKEAADKNEQERHLKQFGVDVREKIKQVTTRDYISLEEKTLDFVILFVPNEMVFSFIYDELHDIWNDAMKKKVILAGPISFVAILRMIFQSYENFTYQENLHEIIKLIKIFKDEYSKYNDEFIKLGERIKALDSVFEVLARTRDKKLTSIIERIEAEKFNQKQSTLQISLPKSEENSAEN